MRLYTKAGDDGQTSLIGKQGVAKNNIRVSAYGDLDELNASLGVALSACSVASTCDKLEAIQQDLFQIGVQLATCPGRTPSYTIDAQQISRLEEWTDSVDQQLAPLTNFVLPGGSEGAARLHLARTICRRAERTVVTLAQQEDVSKTVMAYLNRLSDLLFVLARIENQNDGMTERPWPTPGNTRIEDSANGSQEIQ